MPHAYTEDQLIEQPAIGLFAELGWAVAGPPPNAGVTGEPCDAGLLGRETKGEVVLGSRLRAALERLNASRMGHHALPSEAITAMKIFQLFTRPLSSLAKKSESHSQPTP
jgi:type I restriction enzyme R subunit